VSGLGQREDGRAASHRLVGRDRELVELASVLDAAHHGPIACVVYGPAGIGKTTLWREALARISGQGYRLLTCRPAESEAELSFGGLRDLLDGVPGRVLADLPEPQRHAVDVALLRQAADEPTLGYRAVAVALLGTMRRLAADTPVVLAVDDAQWLDRPTAEAIEYVARRLGTERGCVLATMRGDHESPSPFGLAQALPPDRILRIGLGGLSLGALHSLIHERVGLSLSRPLLRRVEQASGGNPFFALEIARALEHAGGQAAPGEPLPLPQSMGELLVARIERLPADAREVLRVVAALAAPTVDLVVAALGERVGLDGLDRAEEQGVVEVQRGQVRLAHPLFGAAARTSGVGWRRLHKRLADQRAPRRAGGRRTRGRGGDRTGSRCADICSPAVGVGRATDAGRPYCTVCSAHGRGRAGPVPFGRHAAGVVGPRHGRSYLARRPGTGSRAAGALARRVP